MRIKKYTLYFKGINEYGHEHNIPIICVNLRQMDEYTSRFNNYLDLFNSFPIDVKKFIKYEFKKDIDFNDNKCLGEHIFITDSDFDPIMEPVFKDNDDILYVTPDELIEKIVCMKMSASEYQNSLIMINKNNKLQKRCEFFTYLYNTYVKGKKISCMIDVYDASKNFPNLDSDDLLIASIATDKDNIIVLCKKLGEEFESRRNLAFKYKALFNYINGNKKMSFKNSSNKINMDEVSDAIEYNVNKFLKKYNKEYSNL